MNASTFAYSKEVLVPSLETARLLLRMFGKDDVEPYWKMSSDPEVMRFLGDGKPLSRTDAWRHVAIFLGTWQLRGYGTWAVIDKDSGQFIGRVGYIHPEGWPGIELAWALARPFWGRGLATEAARTCLNHGFSVFGFANVISLIHPDNLRSIAIAERLGETKEGSTQIFGKPALIYGIRNSLNP
jgi:RimJ/RimL family protein N-acetyltransferase